MPKHPTTASLPGFVRYVLALVCFALLGGIVFKTTRIETDFSAFLPPSSTPEQRLLISQLRDGLVSRLMLVALEGADEARLAEASRTLAQALAKDPAFDYAANGSMDQFMAQGEVLMRNRYVLSPDVAKEKFTAPALRTALEDQLEQLASPFGVLSRTTLARDPTGEFAAVLRGLDSGAAPQTREGVWFSKDGKRAFLILQTHAPGFNSVEQAEAVGKVNEAVAKLNAVAAGPQVRAILSGPGVFAAESHRIIERDAWRLSMASTLAILALLIFVYRSALPVLLVLTPVAFGLAVGVLVVQTLFGSVHALTLAFAATLIGEAVDYPNYLMLNTAPGESSAVAARRIGRTLTLAVLTTVASATALTLSSFTGLAQLGALTMSGVLVAGLTTRYLIPWLLSDRSAQVRHFQVPLLSAMGAARWLVIPIIIATLAGTAWLGFSQTGWWEQDLSGISPVPAQMRERDAQLRQEMGAPEVSFFLASRGDSEASALQAAEEAIPRLQEWQQKNLIRSFDSPARYIPAPATQAARLHALPDAGTLQKNLQTAQRGLAFRADTFAPFIQDVAAAKTAPPVTRATYAGTPLGSKLNALVVELQGQWLALTPLAGVSDVAILTKVAEALPGGKSHLVDLKQVSAQMLNGYGQEALHQAALGVLLIFVLLWLGLRSFVRTWRVSAPALAALVLTVSLLALCGQRINVFHLVALLLVLGIGLNYGLFFERPAQDQAEHSRTQTSLLICSICTITTFGLLALSSTPVLFAIGSTTALGALLSLLLAAVLARPDQTERAPDAVQAGV